MQLDEADDEDDGPLEDEMRVAATQHLVETDAFGRNENEAELDYTKQQMTYLQQEVDRLDAAANYKRQKLHEVFTLRQSKIKLNLMKNVAAKALYMMAQRFCDQTGSVTLDLCKNQAAFLELVNQMTGVEVNSIILSVFYYNINNIGACINLCTCN